VQRQSRIKKGGWSILLNALGDYVKEDADDETDGNTRYLKAMLSYNVSDDAKLFLQFQTGEFEGLFDDKSSFKTEWTKVDILWCTPAQDVIRGYGIRYLVDSEKAVYKARPFYKVNTTQIAAL